MKYAKLLAVLALNEISLKTPLMGGVAKVSFTEEQLEKIEQALAEKDTSALEKELSTLKEEKNQWNEELSTLKTATQKALTDNKLETSESIIENILLLGEKCKEYGENNTNHSLPTSNGKENNDSKNSIVNMQDAHNQI